MRHSTHVTDLDAHPRPSRARRLVSPAGLVLAGLCLLLPFLSASCASEESPRTQWRITYTGVDVITGGVPDIAFTQDADEEPIREQSDAELASVLGAPPPALPSQLLAWPAAALLVAALAATALPSRRWRAAGTAGLAFAAAIVLGGATMLARHDAADAVAMTLSVANGSPQEAGPGLREWDFYDRISGAFRYAYGLWACLAALVAVGVLDTVRVIRNR